MGNSAAGTARRDHRRAAGLAVALLVAASLGTLGYRRLAGPAPFWGSATPALRSAALRVAPGVYMLGGLEPSAAYAVETSRGLVLIDSGLAPDAARLRAQLAELNLDWKRVRAVLLTHAHGDHCGGAQFLRDATGAKVYAGRGDAAVIRAGGPREAVFSTFHMPNDSPHPTAVDVELAGGEALDFGDTRFLALAAPGHTPGSICYLLERPGLRALFAGDVVMKLAGDAVPRHELGKPLGTYSAYLPPRYRGDARDSLATLRRLRALPAPNLLLPGHPIADPTPQSPAVSRAHWEALLDGGIRDMETLLARYERDGAGFLDGVPKEILPGLYYLGDLRGTAVYGLFAAGKFIAVGAPGGPDLPAFLNDRLARLGRKPTAPVAVLLTSTGPEDTAGLQALVEACHPEVVTTPEGVLNLKGLLPPGTTFVTTDELPARGWFAVTTPEVRGRGETPAAYVITWGGKRALFSGRVPVKINHDAGIALMADFLEDRGDPRGYLTSLARLSDLDPDLWLPAAPTDGQNANLYGADWKQAIADNLTVIRRNLGGARNPAQ